MHISDVDAQEYNEYYGKYISKLSPDKTIIGAFEEGEAGVMTFFKSVPSSRLTYRYADGKWSIKEVLQHLIDTERIFSHRAFRIGRGDTTPLAPFDQTRYIESSGADNKTLDQLLAEFEVGRKASLNLLGSLTSEDLCQLGTASGWPLSARAAACVIPGHDIWHIDIIKERYL